MSSSRYTKFGPYDLCEHLGYGGHASVERAIERDSGRVVALKRLHPQFSSVTKHVRQFIREARLTQALDHPNIVKVHKVGEIEGVLYMSMEWIPGETLSSLLSRQATASPVPVGVTIWILREILGALDYVMSGADETSQPLGIVHRDISPDNVIVTPDGQVKLIDFGLAKSLAGQFATNSGLVKGNLGYMAPEAFAGRDVEQRSDLYSVAILAWELLAHQRLFGGTPLRQLAGREAHSFVAPSKLRGGISQEIDDLLAVALAEDPVARWPSAGAMARVLDIVIRRYGPEAGPEAWMEWRRQPCATRPRPFRSKLRTTRNSVGLMTTLPASSDRRGGRYHFGPRAQTVLDPVFDAGERHRLALVHED